MSSRKLMEITDAEDGLLIRTGGRTIGHISTRSLDDEIFDSVFFDDIQPYTATKRKYDPVAVDVDRVLVNRTSRREKCARESFDLVSELEQVTTEECKAVRNFKKKKR